ncbi:14396_t:CDS:2, partial [Funneliformis caledonium]
VSFLKFFVDYFCPGIVATSPVSLSLQSLIAFSATRMENLTVRIVCSVRKSNRSGSIIEPVEFADCTAVRFASLKRPEFS